MRTGRVNKRPKCRRSRDLKHRELFQCLSDPETPKAALGTSIGLHALLLSFLVVLPLMAPQVLHINYSATVLAPPPPPQQQQEQPKPIKLPPPPKLTAPKPTEPEPKLVAEIPTPIPAPTPTPKRIEAVPQPLAPAPRVVPTPTVIEPKAAPALTLPPPPVVTNVFSNVAAPTLPVAPQRNTEASGFGEVTNNREGSRTGRVGATAASGFGDALSGSREPGRPGKAGGVAAASGFDSAATGGSQGGTNRGTVVAAGFAAAANVSRPPTSTPQKPPESGNEKPVEVLLKPRPEYTDEARKMHIEGEVLVRVLFTSSGEVRVLEVIHGLGYGLNENAVRAAEQIRFKPAQRGGQPVDSAAIVHIAFQLAY